MYTIGKRFSFDAAHQLPDLPAGHKCRRLHGHTYTVEVSLAAEALTGGGPGFVVDFTDLAPLGRYLADDFDHRLLNDVVDFPPTSERLAAHLYWWCVDNLALPGGVAVAAVTVSETPATWARYQHRP